MCSLTKKPHDFRTTDDTTTTSKLRRDSSPRMDHCIRSPNLRWSNLGNSWTNISEKDSFAPHRLQQRHQSSLSRNLGATPCACVSIIESLTMAQSKIGTRSRSHEIYSTSSPKPRSLQPWIFEERTMDLGSKKATNGKQPSGRTTGCTN